MRILFYILFIGVGSLVLAGGHIYLWRRLIRDTATQGRTRVILTWALIVLALLIPVSLGLSRRVDPSWLRWATVMGALWLGTALYLLCLLVPWDLWRGVRRALQRFQRQESTPSPPPLDPERRLFLSRVAAGTALLGTTAVVGLGVRNSGEILRPQVEVQLPRLPKELSGFRIVQISDLHIGPILDDHFLRTIVDEVNALQPDLVAITGDLVDASVDLIGPLFQPLAKLNPRFGTYFVTGNHEYYSEPLGWPPYLEQLGIRVLMNERARIGDQVSFDLVGIPDSRGYLFVPEHRSDIAHAVKGRDPERELVLLAHRPNDVVEAAEVGVGLQLSGHTHGGQFWPVVPLVGLLHLYTAGLHRHTDTTQIYVSRGTGYWGPPIRLGAPAEITTIILTV